MRGFALEDLQNVRNLLAALAGGLADDGKAHAVVAAAEGVVLHMEADAVARHVLKHLPDRLFARERVCTVHDQPDERMVDQAHHLGALGGKIAVVVLDAECQVVFFEQRQHLAHDAGDLLDCGVEIRARGDRAQQMHTEARGDVDIAAQMFGHHAAHSGLEQDALFLAVGADGVQRRVVEIVERQVVRELDAADAERHSLVDEHERRERMLGPLLRVAAGQKRVGERADAKPGLCHGIPLLPVPKVMFSVLLCAFCSKLSIFSPYKKFLHFCLTKQTKRRIL